MRGGAGAGRKAALQYVDLSAGPHLSVKDQILQQKRRSGEFQDGAIDLNEEILLIQPCDRLHPKGILDRHLGQIHCR